jgi:hypothetical protein
VTKNTSDGIFKNKKIKTPPENAPNGAKDLTAVSAVASVLMEIDAIKAE